MAGLLGAGILVMIAADAIVGVRLVRLARRTRRIPELALGASLLLLGAIGYPLSIAARKGLGGSPEASTQVLAAALAFQNLGCAAMAVATLETFRQGVGWARLLAAALVTVLVGSWLARALTGDFHQGTGHTWLYWTAIATRAMPFLWSAIESWHYHAVLRRRLKIGLTDAVVTDRFRLWAISATGVVCGFALFAAALLSGVDVANSPAVLVPTSLMGCLSGASLWLAFLPPRWYLRRFATA